MLRNPLAAAILGLLGTLICPAQPVFTPTLLWDGSADPRFANGANLYPPIVDSQGRLVFISVNPVDSTCGGYPCFRVNSVSPTGTLNWQTTSGLSAQSGFFPVLVLGPHDVIYNSTRYAQIYGWTSSGAVVPESAGELESNAALYSTDSDSEP